MLLIHDYLERLSNLLRNEARRVGSLHSLQPVHLEALHYLAICNRYSNTPLAVTEFLGLTRGTVSQTLNVLEDKGLVVREPDLKDKRVVHLRLTEAGMQLLDSAVPAPLLQAAFGRLDERRQEKLTASLRELLLACQAANDMRSFGVCHTCRYNQRDPEGGYWCGLTQEPLSADDIIKICREHTAA
jgi:DNA-binding MarR family transcriptional regulator